MFYEEGNAFDMFKNCKYFMKKKMHATYLLDLKNTCSVLWCVTVNINVPFVRL